MPRREPSVAQPYNRTHGVQECALCGVCYDDLLTVCPADDAALFTPLSGSRVIDLKYRLEQRIGYGGMGVVYRARHVALGRPFAVKIIQQRVAGDERFLSYFRREAEALGELEHPHIVNVTDFGVDAREGGVAYLVMEYLEGTTLEDHCGSVPMPVAEALPLLEAVARAIDFAHGRGFLHRDLKPSNVFLTSAADRGQSVKVLDFGLARREADVMAETARRLRPPAQVAARFDDTTAPLEDATVADGATVVDHTAGGRLVGTVGYIAPELVAGGSSGRASDLYAFGVLVYRVLTARLPHDAVGTEYLQRQQSEPPIPPSARLPLPAELDAPILKLLEPHPASRPATATAAFEELRRAASQAETRSWRARELPRRWFAAAVIALLAALLIVPLARLRTVQAVEGKSVDARFALMPRRAPDPRIVVVLFDEATIRTNRATLSERADEFGAVLTRVLARGARAVAIDLLLPPRWSESRPFAQLLLRHADAITLAAQSTTDGMVIGPEPLSGFVTVALGAERTAAMFGFAELDVDSDGVTRAGRLSFADAGGRVWPSFAAHAARHLSREPPALARDAGFLIDWRIDPRQYRTISWSDLERLLSAEPEAFRGRLVVVGGAFDGSGDERHRSPAGALPGPLLQAAAIDTIVARVTVRTVATRALVLPAALTIAAIIFLVLVMPRVSRALLAAAAAATLFCGIAVLLARFALLIVPLTAPLTVLLCALAAALGLRSIMSDLPESGDSQT